MRKQERKEYCSCLDGSNIRLEQITYLLSLSLSSSKQATFFPSHPFPCSLSLSLRSSKIISFVPFPSCPVTRAIRHFIHSPPPSPFLFSLFLHCFFLHPFLLHSFLLHPFLFRLLSCQKHQHKQHQNSSWSSCTSFNGNNNENGERERGV